MAKTKKIVRGNDKMQSCMAPHAIMHSLFGFGLALFLVSLFPDLGAWWLGILIMIIAFVWDMKRK